MCVLETVRIAFEVVYVALWQVQQLDVIGCREQQQIVSIRIALRHALSAAGFC
jgi:hypothetical protein